MGFHRNYITNINNNSTLKLNIMKTFRTNSRLNKLIKSENINLINKISNNLFNIDFNQLPLNYKNIVFTKYLETK